MYRIGDFSILKGVTIKTLRYYDSIDLFKPEVVDMYTGYRYYSDKQLDDFDVVTKYKNLGFSLEKIKELLKTEKEEDFIREKIKELTNEIIEKEDKIRALRNILSEDDIKVEFKSIRELPSLGRIYTIKNRNEIDEKLKEIKQELDELNIEVFDALFYNFELGYEEENIDCFIGYTLRSPFKPENIGSLKYFGGNRREDRQLVCEGKKENLNEMYKAIVSFAHNANIQIRGFFSELYEEDTVTVYVEAFDLNKVNEDYMEYLEDYNPSKELDKELVGKYVIREILPDIQYMFNPKKQKSMLDTKFKELILKEDGTTNFDNITWDKNGLIMKYDDRLIPLHLHNLKDDYEDGMYIEIFMNESFEYYKSQRPMVYLYKRID